MKLKSIVLLIAAFAFACIGLQAQPPKYSVTFLSALETSSLGYYSAQAMNNKGQIAGYYNNFNNGDVLAFLYSNGTVSYLGTLSKVPRSVANGINLYGQVVGHSDTTKPSRWHAFLYSNETMIDLGSLLGSKGYSIAFAINDLGQAVGYSSNPDTSVGSAVFWEGKVAALGSLEGPSGSGNAYGINNNVTGSSTGLADIVGDSSTSEGWTHAFLYSNGVMTDIGAGICPPSLNSSLAISINDAKQIAGTCCLSPVGTNCASSAPSSTAFFYDSVSKSYNFINLGKSNYAWDINNAGQIVGTYTPEENNPSGLPFPFLYMNGESYALFDLIAPGSGLNDATSLFINDEGQIVANTNKGVVLLTPVSEE